MSPTTAAYLAHVRRLRLRAQVWRIVVTLVLAMVGQALLTASLFLAAARGVTWVSGAPFDSALDELVSFTTPLSLLVLLLTFMGFILAVLAAMRWLHRAPVRMLFGLTNRLNRRAVVRSSVLFIGIGLAAFAGSWMFTDYIPNATPPVVLQWLLPMAIAIFIQIFAEELFFRGYMQSVLAARFQSPLVWVIVPNVIFSALHLPTALRFAENAWLIMTATTLVGLIATHLTVRTGNLAAAIGLHYANNLIAFLVIAFPGEGGQLSLFTYGFELSDAATVRPMLMLNIVVILLAYVIFLALTPPHTKIATSGARH